MIILYPFLVLKSACRGISPSEEWISNLQPQEIVLLSPGRADSIFLMQNGYFILTLYRHHFNRSITNLQTCHHFTSARDDANVKCCCYRLYSLLHLGEDNDQSISLHEGAEGVTAAWLARRAHVNRIPNGEFHAVNFRQIMAFILHDTQPMYVISPSFDIFLCKGEFRSKCLKLMCCDHCFKYECCGCFFQPIRKLELAGSHVLQLSGCVT